MSAVEDLNDAVNIISKLEKNSDRVDVRLCVKTFLTRNLLQEQKNDTVMVEDLTAVAKKLREVNKRSRYFDRKTLAANCIDCTENLIDMNMQNLFKAFTNKVMSLIIGRKDAWSEETHYAANAMAGHTLTNKGRSPAPSTYSGIHQGRRSLRSRR